MTWSRERSWQLTPGVRRALAAAATVGVLAGSAASVAFLAAAGDDEARVALVGSTSASASVSLQERRWGTAIDLEVQGLDAGVTYGVWLERRAGGRVPAGTFRPDGTGTFRLSLASAEQLAGSRSVGVARLPSTTDDRTVDVLSAPLP